MALLLEGGKAPLGEKVFLPDRRERGVEGK